MNVFCGHYELPYGSCSDRKTILEVKEDLIRQNSRLKGLCTTELELSVLDEKTPLSNTTQLGYLTNSTKGSVPRRTPFIHFSLTIARSPSVTETASITAPSDADNHIPPVLRRALSLQSQYVLDELVACSKLDRELLRDLYSETLTQTTSQTELVQRFYETLCESGLIVAFKGSTHQQVLSKVRKPEPKPSKLAALSPKALRRELPMMVLPRQQAPRISPPEYVTISTESRWDDDESEVLCSVCFQDFDENRKVYNTPCMNDHPVCYLCMKDHLKIHTSKHVKCFDLDCEYRYSTRELDKLRGIRKIGKRQGGIRNLSLRDDNASEDGVVVGLSDEGEFSA